MHPKSRPQEFLKRDLDSMHVVKSLEFSANSVIMSTSCYYSLKDTYILRRQFPCLQMLVKGISLFKMQVNIVKGRNNSKRVRVH